MTQQPTSPENASASVSTSNRRRFLTVVLALALVAVAAVVAILTLSKDEEAFPATAALPLGLAVDGAPAEMTIGVLYSLTDAPQVESSLISGAEGAQVAAYRLGLEGTKVNLVTANDSGTDKGVADAMNSLEEAGVSGVIVATDGPQSAAIADEARARNIPIIFLAGTDAADGKSSWSVFPDASATVKLLASAIEDSGLSKTLAIDYNGALTDLKASTSLTYTVSTDKDALVDDAVAAVRADGAQFDSLAISGPAQFQGELVAALQGRGISLPTFVTPQAQIPQFGETLAAQHGAVADLTSVGVPSVDMVALDNTPQGASAATFLTAVALLAGDTAATDLLHEQQFEDVADQANAMAHDILIALVHAAAEAGSAEPDQVLAALSGIVIDAEEGTAVGKYSFDSPVVTTPAVQRATTDTPHLRVSKETTIFWYTPSK